MKTLSRARLRSMSRESNRNWYAVAIPACSICAVLASAMFIHLIVYLIIKRRQTISKPKKLGGLSKFMSILIIMCCCFSMLGCLTETLRYSCALLTAPDNLLHSKWVNIADDLFHFGGQFLFYIVSLFRIKTVFSGTQFRLKKWLIATFMALFCIQLAWNMWHVVNVIIAFFFLDATNEETLNNVMVIPVMLMCSFSFLLNISLFTLFNVKLQRVIYGALQDADRNDPESLQRYEIMLDVLIKCNLLFGTAIFTNELFYVSLIVNKYSEFHGWYVFLARCVENFSNISAVYLSHAAGKPVYHRVCGACHGGMKNLRAVRAGRNSRFLSVSVAVDSPNTGIFGSPEDTTTTFEFSSQLPTTMIPMQGTRTTAV